MRRPPYQRLGLVLLACFGIAFTACKKQGFKSGGNGIKRKADAIDAEDKNDTLGNDAFVGYGNGSPTDGTLDRVQTTIPVARVCSNRYSEKARTNLLMAEHGVVVAFTDPRGELPPVTYGDDDPQALRVEMIERGTMTVQAPKGNWNMHVCDVRMPQCYQAQTGFNALGVDGIGKLGGASGVGFGNGPQAEGRLGVLYNINQEQQQMFAAFQNILMQGMFSGGMGLVNPGDVAFCDDSVSPLIIDLEGKGIQLTSPADGVKFDIDANGKPDQISWPSVESGVGFLVLDIDGDGEITDGTELFGNYSIGPDGDTAANGFLALAKYDTNADGHISAADDIWQNLQIWRDSNSNGKSSADELSSLDSLGVSLLDLTYIDGYEMDPYGNWTNQRSVALVNEDLRMVFDVWFRVNR